MRLCISILLLFACLIPAWAQSTTGNIAGTVADPSGAPVAGAKVTAINLSTNVTRTTVWAFAIVVAINQLGIATNLINTLFTGFVGALAVALGLAFGLGGRDLASRTLENWYDQTQDAKPRRKARTDE